MKKITLLLLLVLSFVITNEITAQTLNQNASWPNTAWTVGGTFDMANPNVFEGDPTVDANFAYDDDDQGNVTGMNDNDVFAASPVIDLTAAFGAGETWLTISGDYVYRYLANDELKFQYWDADASAWTDWGFGFSASTTDAPTNNYCSVASVTYASDILNIVNFTATQLSGFQYRISYDDNPAGADWNYGFCFQSPTITSAVPPTCPDPVGLTANSTTGSSVDLAWTEIGTAVIWDLELVDITASETASGNATSTGVPNPFTLGGLTPENDYEIYVRSDCGGSTSTWVGPVAFTTPAACEVVSSVAFTSLTTTQIVFGWDAPTTGTPVSYTWEIVPSGNAPGVDTVATATETDPDTEADSGMVLSPNTEYDVYITTDCGGDGLSAVLGPLGFTTEALPPANDNACDAIAIPLGTATSTAPYTTDGATIETAETGPSCSFVTAPSTSVWFSFVAPVSGEVLIATEPVGGGTLGDTTLTVFTIGDCTDLATSVEIACDDDDDANVVGNGSGLHANIILTALTVGNTYYFAVDGYGNASGTFDVAVSDATLSVDSLENENVLTFYPNPVKNELTLSAQKEIQNVSVYNILGQEVHRTAPNSIHSTINMDGLSRGAYFVKVTIGNITETIRIIKQ